MLVKKYEGKKQVEDEPYANWGRLSSYGLEEDEYAKYQQLVEYTQDLQFVSMSMESYLVSNKDIQKLLDNASIKQTENEIRRTIASAGVGALLGAGIAAGLALILKNAKKKEEIREMEREESKEDGKEV